ncbi:MAG TPA: hypothetical protein VJ767_02310 [Nitrososphaeraceae archaeon]|nr:hypothetical protein [Nitrososphaeraceae archaeon]
MHQTNIINIKTVTIKASLIETDLPIILAIYRKYPFWFIKSIATPFIKR